MEDRKIEVPGCPGLVIQVCNNDKEYVVIATEADDLVANALFPGHPNLKSGAGATNEALISIVFDRLERFQAGPNPCDENEEILDHLASTLLLLEYRRLRISKESSL